MSDERTGTIEVAGRLRLFFRSRVTAESRGRLLAVHGLGQHSGRLTGIAESARRLDLDYYALDLRGHGRSPGRRGHVSSFDRLLSDLDRLRRRTGNGEPRRPTFLLGHSLGGLVVGRYVQEFGFPGLAGAALVAPFVDVARTPPTWKLRLGAVADRWIPALTLYNELPPEMLYRTAVEVDGHVSDPLVHHRISARMWGEMQRQATILVDRARQSRVPVLIQVAGEDRAVSSRAALDLADAFEGESQAIEYEGAYHDLYRDPLAGDAARDLEEWIEGRLDRMGSAEGNVAV